MRKLFLPLFILCASVSFGQAPQQLLALSDSLYSFNPDSSWALACMAETSAAAEKEPSVIARAKTRKARYLILKSKLEEATAEVNSALALYESLGDDSGRAYSLKLKSILLKRIGNSKEAIALQEEAVALYRKNKDVKGKVSVLLNLSLDYMADKNFVKTREVLDEIYSSRSSMEKETMYFYHQNNGTYYFKTENHEEAIREYEKAAMIAKEHKLTDSYITLLMLLSRPHTAMGNYAKAEKLLEESKALAIEHHLDHELSEALHEMTELYRKMKKYDRAFALLQEQTELDKKLYDLEKVNYINELEKKLEVSKKEEKIIRQQAELEQERIHRAQIRSQNLRLWLGIAGTLAIASLVLALYFRTRSLKNKLHVQKKIVEEKQKEILDSINYAKRIQSAIFPSMQTCKAIFPQSFIFFLPKNVVSGDFYWFTEKNGKKIIAAVDCTGHGVPGAFMSMIGAAFLNEIVNERGITRPGDILGEMRFRIIESLKQKDAASGAQDGMDMALLAFDESNSTAEFAGANNPVWVCTGEEEKRELKEYLPDRRHIGYFMGKGLPFSNTEIKYGSGDCFYLFSDGYSDQFGGPQGKKFRAKRFKEQILSSSSLPMEMQEEKIIHSFADWKKNHEQVDDILVIGIKM